MKNKNCANCGCEVIRKPSFWKRIKGLSCCSKDCRAQYLKEHYIGSSNPNFRSENITKAWWTTKQKNVKHSAQQRNIFFDLTQEQLENQYVKQNGMCYYTGVPLQLASSKNWKAKNQADIDVLSIDRKDSNEGYTVDNIVFCCNGINKLKENSSAEEMQSIFNYIVAKHMDTCKIKVKKLREMAGLPQKAKLGDAGFDLFAAEVEDQGDFIKVYSGIAVQPVPGWYCEIYDRSSNIKKGLMLHNSVGIIDNGYTGEIIMVFLKTKKDASIQIGDRVAQLIPRQYACVEFVEVEELSSTERGDGGFGSTGTK